MTRFFVFSIVLAACGDVHREMPDAAVRSDADPDAPVAVLPAPGRDIAVAAGRVSGGSWLVDIHLGSVTSQAQITGATWTARGGTPITP